MQVGLLLLRVVIGGTVALHGLQKVFACRGLGLEGTHGMVRRMGLRPARPLAVLLAISELVGGLLLVVGCLTPLGAAAVVGVMLSASRLVHWPNGFWAQRGGYELPMVLGAAAVAVAFTGPGRFSVDHALGWRLWGNAWGAGVALVALASSLAIVALSRQPVFHRGDGMDVA
jgi:putative oxidoreductase